MTTKLREGFIAFCRSKWRYIYYIAFWTIYVLLGICIDNEIFDETLLLIYWIIVFLLWIVLYGIGAIKRCQEEKLFKNKLIYLILSDSRAVSGMVIMPSVILGVLVLTTVEINMFNIICIFILCLIIPYIFSYFISEHFKKKLSE